MSVYTRKLAAESEYYNPDSLVQLLNHANMTKVMVEGMEIMALMDTGSQISALTEGSCTEMWLKILPLGKLIEDVLHLEGLGVFDTIQRIHEG